MNVEIKKLNGYIKEYKNIWEIQDNGNDEIVLKKHDHKVIRFDADDLQYVHVEIN